MDIDWLLKKTHAVLRKGPATARNILFSRFDYWPTRRLKREELLDIPVYCVNLPRDQRRRHIIQRQVDALGFRDFQFVDGVPGESLDLDVLGRQGLYDDATARELHGRSLSLNYIGGSLSHGRCYEMIVARDVEIAMVIEDDALFIPSRLDRVDLASLPCHWDIAFLNTFLKEGVTPRRIKGTLYDGDAYWGSAAAYLVSRKGARLLADFHRPVVNAADGLTGDNRLDRYVFLPDCVLNGSVCYYYNSTIPQDWIAAVKASRAAAGAAPATAK